MYLTEEQSKDEKLIRYLVEQVVAEPISIIKPITNGKVSYVYDVDDSIIVKFPSHKTPIANWITQTENAPVLQSLLSFKIPLPQLKRVFLNSTSDEGILSFSYSKINGRIISKNEFASQSKSFKQRFFEQLSDAAIEIHSINPYSLPIIPLTTEELIRKMFPVRANNTVFNKLFQTLIHLPIIGFGNVSKRILCHSDLHSGNVCLDKKDNLVGILDFDSLTRGAHFVEFRPTLYKDKDDNQMFKEIYSKRSGHHISAVDVHRMRALIGLLLFSCVATNPKTIMSFKRRKHPLFYFRSRE